MYAYIEGKLTVKEPAYMVVDVGGVGYFVKISLNTYSALKNSLSAKLHTYLHVKEDAMVLYGFFDKSEKDVFLDLISISGVGPGTALLILSSLTPSELRDSILTGEVRRIQNVKGIGAKTAQRIILELKDKMAKGDFPDKGEVIMGISHNTLRNEALTALTTLGINKAMAEKTVDSILKKGGGDITLEDLIKQALKTS
jgi:holliday junction DNA helicase RuvA